MVEFLKTGECPLWDDWHERMSELEYPPVEEEGEEVNLSWCERIIKFMGG